MHIALDFILHSNLSIDNVSKEYLIHAFESIPSLLDDHPAFREIANFKRSKVLDSKLILKLAEAIDKAYSKASLSTIDVGCEIESAKDLILLYYTMFTNPLESPDVFKAMLECGYITEAEIKELEFETENY